MDDFFCFKGSWLRSTMVGFLDGLCDYMCAGDAGEFWKIENLFASTTLGAVVPLIASSLTCVAVIVLWRNSSSTNKTGYYYRRQLIINDPSGETSTEDCGYEESKASLQDHEDNGFATSASVPLLGNYSNGNGAMVDFPESESKAYVDCDSVDGRGITLKKGTGVHWLKLLLNAVQVAFRLSVAGNDFVDRNADDPYKCEYKSRTTS